MKNCNVVKVSGPARAAISLLLASAIPVTHAQNDASLENVKQCAQIQDAAERYACYDRATASLRSGSFFSAPARVTAPSSARDVPANGPTAARVISPAELEPEQPAAEFVARIAAVGEHEPGQMMITLENGQVWYQQDDRRYALRSDMEVRIYPGLFGSSWRMASNELKGFIQVKRLK